MNIRVNGTGAAMRVSKANLAPLISSIENPALRAYCAEQLHASQTASEFDATVRLVFELAPVQATLCPN